MLVTEDHLLKPTGLDTVRAGVISVQLKSKIRHRFLDKSNVGEKVEDIKNEQDEELESLEQDKSSQKLSPEDIQIFMEYRLEEAVGLALALDLEVVHQESVVLRQVNPSIFIGSGQAESIKNLVQQLQITLIIIDNQLSPVQQRNLEKLFQCKVIDRTNLILEIFGKRAKTKEGTLQVELAFLEHQRSRLVRAWSHLERQRGGHSTTSGPGELQKELDRRRLDLRILKIKQDLKEVKRTRALQRQQRKKNEIPIVALVGYTNAGKSTLFNALTKADVLSKNVLFATLDPTMRQLVLPSHLTCILSDTVGFISDLPLKLIEAFHATLEEVIEADIILHVRDIANKNTENQKKDVLSVLSELGIELKKTGSESLEKKLSGKKGEPILIEVCNKIDLCQQLSEQKRSTCQVCVSALTEEGLTSLLERVEESLFGDYIEKTITVPYTRPDILSFIHKRCSILSQEDFDEGSNICLKAKKYTLEQIEEMIKSKYS
jgi:GTP-binding protein HflX